MNIIEEIIEKNKINKSDADWLRMIVKEQSDKTLDGRKCLPSELCTMQNAKRSCTS